MRFAVHLQVNCLKSRSLNWNRIQSNASAKSIRSLVGRTSTPCSRCSSPTLSHSQVLRRISMYLYPMDFLSLSTNAGCNSLPNLATQPPNLMHRQKLDEIVVHGPWSNQGPTNPGILAVKLPAGRGGPKASATGGAWAEGLWKIAEACVCIETAATAAAELGPRCVASITAFVNASATVDFWKGACGHVITKIIWSERNVNLNTFKVVFAILAITSKWTRNFLNNGIVI